MNSLFEPITLGTMQVKNRFVRSAVNDYYCNPDGAVSEEQVGFFENLAVNEVGLIISGHAYIKHPQGRASFKQNGIYEDKFIAPYTKAAQAVQKHGCRFVVQISHAGGMTLADNTEGKIPIAPSPVPSGPNFPIPREMKSAEVDDTIADFVSAAMRVKKAGCDGVQIHCAHGYLLSQFISPYFNRRTDKWGGNVENRSRILFEVISGIKDALGGEFPVLVKIDSDDGHSGADYLRDVVSIAKLLDKLGAASLEISGNTWRNARGEAYYLNNAVEVKKHVNLPVILVGGLRSYALMKSIVQKKQVDMVSLARPFICEPDLVVRFCKGQSTANCTTCDQCRHPQGVRCIRNKNK